MFCIDLIRYFMITGLIINVIVQEYYRLMSNYVDIIYIYIYNSLCTLFRNPDFAWSSAQQCENSKLSAAAPLLEGVLHLDSPDTFFV